MERAHCFKKKKYLEKKCFMKSYFVVVGKKPAQWESETGSFWGSCLGTCWTPAVWPLICVCYWGGGVCCEEKMMMGDDLNVRREEYNKNKGFRRKRPPINCTSTFQWLQCNIITIIYNSYIKFKLKGSYYALLQSLDLAFWLD